MRQYKAFTLSAESKLDALITEVFISSHIRETGKLKQSEKKWRGLWDTGASKSSISERVVSDLGLIPIGQANICTANGIIAVNTYFVNIFLPNGITYPLIVSCSNLGQDIDMLLGMDIIQNGDFSITNVDNKTVFSFRIPSIQTIDYVAEYGGDNGNTDR